MKTKNNEVYKKLKVLLRAVLPLIKPALNAAYFPKSINNYPTLSYDENGFPKISAYTDQIDLNEAFKRYAGNTNLIDLNEFSVFDDLVKILKTIPEITSYYTVSEKTKEKHIEIGIKGIIQDFIERYYYLHGDTFEEEKFYEIYKPIENYIYAEELWFDISYPLLFITFNFESFELASGILIRRLSDDANKARHRIVSYSPVVVDSVFMAATHELVLQGFHYKKPANWYQDSFSKAHIYPQNEIQKFLTAIKIISGETSGYAQCLIYPRDWAERYDYDLLHLSGAMVRYYPGYFDHYFWTVSKYPEIPDASIEEIKSLYAALLETKENKLDFAQKRLYKSIQREDDDDVIVDLIIAMEMLLSDNEKSEITHKLALRAAFLLSRKGERKDATQTFENIKKIYAYRSKVVHGTHDPKKSKELKIDENTTVPIIQLAGTYLGEILRIVSKNPELLDPTSIDKLMLEQN